jgi:class 3 adenylate cyclase
MAHVLFMDIVAYSQQPMERQNRLVTLLQALVRETPAYTQAHQHQMLICLPTGDGMALAFFGDPEAPVRCAVELAGLLHAHPELKLRMGVHSGPVYRVADINANCNVAGGGINMAQRVMDCGDQGHILISDVVAGVLEQLEKWQGCIHDLGVAEVKHGVHVHVFSLKTADAGNAEMPHKLSASGAAPHAAMPSPSAAASIAPAHVESVSKELATFIGPIAKVVVERAAERCSCVDELYHTCASEIDCEKERARFMATRKHTL